MQNKKKRDLVICKLAAQGKPQAEIAKKVGLGQTGVSRVVRKEENRKIIEQETTKLLASLPEIVNQFENNVDISKKLLDWISNPQYETDKDGNKSLLCPTLITDPKDAIAFLNGAYKQKSDMLKALGVFPSQNLSMFIQNIYEDNRKQVLCPEVLKAFGDMFSTDDEDVEDAEYKEEE